MTKKAFLPQLRFPDFNDSFSELTLENLCTVNPKNEKLPRSFIYIDLESVSKGELNKEVRVDLDKAPSRAQRLLEKGDILYQTVRPYQKNNYHFNKNDLDFVASTGYAQLRSKKDSKYLFQLLHTQRFCVSYQI